MRLLPRALPLLLPLVAVGCKPPVRMTPPPADAPAEQVALSGASVLIGAGDIARCESSGDEATAALVDSVLRADSAAGVHDEVFTLGDNAYPNGSARAFAECFGASWGDTARLIMKNIRPTPGNHEHLTDRAAPYYKYFGDRAGSASKGYYSYDIGEWHAIVLNSELVVNTVFTDEERREQEEWLAKDLKDHQKLCTLAYWHHARFSSGWHGDEARMAPFWQLLYDANADLILGGHDHEYERFHPQTPDGVADSARGLTQIVVGTGGGDLRGFRGPASANSASRIEGHFGVLKLTLGAAEWRSAFLDTSGRTWDETGGKCH